MLLTFLFFSFSSVPSRLGPLALRVAYLRDNLGILLQRALITKPLEMHDQVPFSQGVPGPKAGSARKQCVEGLP